MTDAPIGFHQRRFGVRVDFEFRRNDFGYGIRDVAGGRGVSIAYESLDIDARSSFAIPNAQYLMRWMILPYLALLAIWAVGPGAVSFPVIAIMLIGTVAVFLAGTLELTAVTFTEIATFGTDAQGVRGFIRIIRDRQHDAIFDELTRRWRTRVRSIAGTVNLDAEPEGEALRLGWLRDRGVLSDAEHDWAIEQLRDRIVGGGATAH